MEFDDLKAKLQKHRPWILQGEVCSLFHDLGKLSSAFLNYRANWHRDPHGYDKDPHDHGFLKEHDNLLKGAEEADHAYSQLLKAMKTARKEFGLEGSPAEAFSPERIMSSHVKPWDSIYEFALKSGDSIDSAQDRNNPLFSAEQTDRLATISENRRRSWGRIFRGNVFGFEGPETAITPEQMDKQRELLYTELLKPCDTGQALIDRCWGEASASTTLSPEDRWRLLETLERHYEVGCADTTRPDNDTSLWEHIYAVASLTKALQANYVIYGNDTPLSAFRAAREEHKDNYFDDAQFTIWGFGWDAVRFIGRGQKIHDLGARRKLLADIRHRARTIVEHEHALGNSVYEDDNRALFLIPPLRPGDSHEAYKQLLREIQKEILNACRDEDAAGEVWPRFVSLTSKSEGGVYLECAGTHETTDIVKVLDELDRLNDSGPAITSDVLTGDLLYVSEQNAKTWENGADVCPICGMRPAKEDDEQGRICTTCQNRRLRWKEKLREKVKAWRKPDPLLTPPSNALDAQNSERFSPFGSRYLSEIAADSNGRLALIVGSFNLRDWLSGDRVRSLFVTEAHGLGREVEQLGLTRQMEKGEGEVRKGLVDCYGDTIAEFNYERIKEQVEATYDYLHAPDKDAFDPTRKKVSENTVCLYGRRTLGTQINREPPKKVFPWDSTPPDLDILINRLLAKTPTPSTVLDVWRTTEAFFQSICADERSAELGGGSLISRILLERSRMGLHVNKPSIPLIPFAAYSARVADGQDGSREVEFVFEGDANPTNDTCVVWIVASQNEDWKPEAGAKMTNIVGPKGALPEGFVIEITGDPEIAYEKFHPYREILETPDMFMLLIPADKAIEFTEAIQEEFHRRFGKVYGRLPFSLGNIFFQQHLPMFLVLDAGQRMLRNFTKLHRGEGAMQTWTIESSESGAERRVHFDEGFSWSIPVLLGDGQTDYHHPYMLVERDTLTDRKSYCPVPGGAAVHWDDLRKGDKIKLVRSLYDYEFLDNTAARFRIPLDMDRSRSNPLLNDSPTRPIRLEALDQTLVRTWEVLKQSGIADSSLRDMVSILLVKMKEWEVTLPIPDAPGQTTAAADEWLKLVDLQLGTRLGRMGPETMAYLKRQFESGLFFESVSLFLHVLKYRLGEKEEVNGL